MKLENYEVHLPSYSIGNTIYDKIGPVCESYGKTVLVIGGKQALDAALDKIRAAVEQTNLKIIGVELFGKDCTYANVERLRAMPIYHEADMVFGVGGGKALDTVKCLCITDDKPVFTFPTIASNCSACTAVSIMYNEDGTFLKPNFFVRPAMHAFIDTEIIAKAPCRYMWRAWAIPTPSSMKRQFPRATSAWSISRRSALPSRICAAIRCSHTAQRALQTIRRASPPMKSSRLFWQSSSQPASLRFS